ncbi:Golgi apparatus membrane protein TVP23 homolog B-like isoform X2 [Dysidea avara]|uniref:Golgi apparatus membrane protein TVP23 homolog B-like isoform X2 n=1 Tax=Dysidea avara TaxID=196820 RepID=UPI0033247BA0
MADRATLYSFEDRSGSSLIKHPVAVIFHLLFRVLALVFYIICSIYFSFTGSVLTIILLLAIDFWIVKNVTGRLLAGLRWWNKVEEDGSSSWVFEARKDQNKVNSSESWIFWVSLLACPLVWVLFMFVCLLKLNLNWLVVTVVGVVLNGANVVGYVKCRRDAGTKLTSMAGQLLGQQILKQVTTRP